MAEVPLAASARAETGSASTRRLRTTGKIPAIVYGHGVTPLSVAVDGRDLRGALTTDSGLNALINLKVDGKQHLVLARELQKHPVRGTISHVDFQIVRRDEQVHADVPLNFVGEADGVTKMGGVVEFVLNSLAVTATPANLPAHIDVDISELGLDEPLRVQDIKLPNGVTTSIDLEEPVVTGNIPTVVLSPEEEAAASSAEEAASGDKAQA